MQQHQSETPQFQRIQLTSYLGSSSILSSSITRSILTPSHNPFDKLLVSEYLASFACTRHLRGSSTKHPSACVSTEDLINLSFGQCMSTLIGRRVQQRVSQFSHVDLTAIVLIERSQSIHQLLARRKRG